MDGQDDAHFFGGDNSTSGMGVGAGDGSEEDVVPTAPLTTWLLLIFIATLSFWCQATVTEERFVPSLNVIANHFHISDDVAGATLMAAGASSPELFSSIVALFITHSALGLGTIVGSEIFNQLVICAGAVMAARGNTLTLDKAIVTREVGFYALSIALLYNALKDRHLDPDDGTVRIYVTVWDAGLLFGAYVLYVLVCGYFDSVVGFVTACGSAIGLAKKTEANGLEDEAIVAGGNGTKTYGTLGPKTRSKRVAIDIDDSIPFLHQASPVIREPRENFFRPDNANNDGGSAPPNQQDEYLVKTGGETEEQRQKQQSSAIDLYATMASDRLAQTTAEDLIGGGGGGVPESIEERKIRFHERAKAEDGKVAVGSGGYSSERSLLGRFSDGLSIRLFTFVSDTEKPSDRHDLYDIEFNAFEERLSCFLWQRSIFYNKAKVAMRGWHLRWFNFMDDRIVSVPDRRNFSRYQLKYPRFREMEVDEDRLILRFKNPIPTKRDYFLMAPSSQIFNEVIKKCEELMRIWDGRDSQRELDGEEQALAAAASHPSGAVEIDGKHSPGDDDKDGDENDDNDGDDDDHESTAEPSLIEFPAGEGWIGIGIYAILFPLKLAIHLTIPDVRKLSIRGEPESSLLWSFASIVLCLAWLVVGSYAMVASLESLAALMDVPDAVIGVTVSAAGTSLPNYVASQCAARQGFGNMAVSNAFGSNTFNILVGLGLPWFLYTIFVTRGEPYDGLRDDGIVVSVIILGSVLLLFVVLILLSNFVLYRWHAPAFLGLYGLYLAYCIGQVYIGGLSN